MTRIVLALSVVVCLFGGVADVEAASRHVVIIDLTADPPTVVAVPSTARDLPPTIDAACNGTDGHSPQEIQQCVGCLRTSSTLRWVSTRGDIVDVYVLYDGVTPAIRFREQARKSRIATDLGSLMKLAKGIAFEAGGGGLRCATSRYVLERKRATLTITAQEVSAATGGVNPEAGGGDAAAPVKAEAVLVTGPTEHWFLSADLPFRRFNELKLDESTKTVKPAKTPTAFFLGLDYALGDLLSEGGAGSWRDTVVIKGMFKASKQPLDAFGLALGYRGPLLSSLGLDFSAVSPFVGLLWARSDVAAEGEPPGTAGKLTSTVQVGFSFNLKEALSWAGGGEQ